MFCSNVFSILLCDLRKLYNERFIKHSLIKIDPILNLEIKTLLEKHNEIWFKHIKLYIDDYYKKEYKKKKYRTFNTFSMSRFNLALKELNKIIFSNNSEDEWSKIFTHWLRTKITLMKSFIEQFSKDTTISNKEKMISIINLYHIWLSILADDIKFLYKERVEEIISINKQKLNEFSSFNE